MEVYFFKSDAISVNGANGDEGSGSCRTAREATSEFQLGEGGFKVAGNFQREYSGIGKVGVRLIASSLR